MDIRKKIFISYASENKISAAKPLAKSLLNRGFKVWYDEYSLFLGDSLKKTIDRGLTQCDYAVIILSKAFFSKHWTQEELDGVVALESQRREKIVLPIMFEITYEDVVRYSPTLAGKKLIHFADGIENVVESISESINAESRSKFLDDRYASLDVDKLSLSFKQMKPLSFNTASHHGHMTFNKDPNTSWKRFYQDMAKTFEKLDDEVANLEYNLKIKDPNNKEEG